MSLVATCAAQGVTLNAEHVAEVEKLFDGTLLKQLLALIVKYGPAAAQAMPAILAALATGQYLVALQLIMAVISA